MMGSGNALARHGAWRRRVTWSALAGALLVCVLAMGAAAPAGAAGLVPPADPPASIPPSPDFNQSCAFSGFDTTAACQTAALAAIDNARAAEGLGKLVLPTNYSSLTMPEQLLVVANIERIDRGIAPIVGLVAALNTPSQAASTQNGPDYDDPVPPSNYPCCLYDWGSIWAGGYATVLGAVYSWMYDDGLDSPNLDCTPTVQFGCWGHRNNILLDLPDTAVMGAGAGIGEPGGNPLVEFAAIFADQSAAPAAGYTFTWSQELADLPGAPTVSSVSPTTGPATGGTTVTITGTNLGQVGSVTIGGVTVAAITVSADGTTLTFKTPATNHAGAASIALLAPKGQVTVGSFTYTASPPSVPLSVAMQVGSTQATLTWKAPAATGGSALTAYTAEALVGGVVVKSVSVGPAKLTATVTGLTNGVGYRFGVIAADAAGSSPVAQTGLAVPPFATTTAFVTRQYQDIVSRAPTAAELSSGIAALTDGPGPAQFVGSLRRGTDATTKVDPVTRLYFAYFLRIPDVGGLTYWIGKARGGENLYDISNAFAASSEFKNTYGALSNSQFVTQVYENVLGRPPDAGGLSYWVNALNTKADTRGKVMVGFSESNEYKTAKLPSVDTAVTWIDLLGVSPATADFNTWVTSLTSGGKTVSDLAGALMAMPAYATRVA
jgi:hypothetical protein